MATANNTRRPKQKRVAPGVYQRRTEDGPVFIALVRLAGFTPASKTFPTKDEATAWKAATEKELVAQRERGRTRMDLPKLTLGALVREYLEDPAIKALRSYETYHERLDWWIANHGTVRVLDVSVLLLREARVKLQHGRENATVNRYVAALRTAWNWGRAAGIVPTERAWPGAKLMLPEPKGRTRYLSDVELSSLLDAVRDRGATEYAMVTVSLATGMRQGELLRLTWGDIDVDRASVRVLLTKNSESRVTYLPAAAIKALRAICPKDADPTAPCFLDSAGEPYRKDTIHHWWNVARNTAGITNFRWHDLRHSCASFLAQNGASLLEIGSVLGHKSPSVTMRYAHLIAGRAVTGHDALDAKLRGKA